MNIFQKQIEQEAITRIKKFAKLAKSMGFEICVGFSGGKDSQVVYDLCLRAGIDFKAYFNHAFEKGITLKFIKEYYPNVIWRRPHKFGFIENIKKNHNGLLPTVQMAYCCQDYKHNPHYVDNCSMIGVRKSESAKRANRTALSIKNKTTLKKNVSVINEYFKENCQSLGTASIIQLLPIVDWSDSDVCDYINSHNLPINPEYKNGAKRVGCIVCPKANFSSNYKSLFEHPKLIDAFIKAHSCNAKNDWVISSENRDCTGDKCYYICRWLNRSFMPFTKRQQKEYEQVKKIYEELKSKEKVK